jgi:hypothetical protein
MRLRVAVLALAFSLLGAITPAFGAAPAKLDPGLQALVAGKKAVSAHGATLKAPTVVRGGRALVDVYVKGSARVMAAARKLRALGMDVQAMSRREPERMVEGMLPIKAAPKVAGLSVTKGVLSGDIGGTNTGSVLSQGDAAQRGPQARALGPTGAGVKVGVMSDSMNQVPAGVAGSQGTGDLPANVTVLNDAAGGADEGRAMAEIVYDEAPGVTDMVFDTGTTGAATKAAHIADLVSSGAKVIADDTFYLGEPFFQDGTVSQAVDAAKAAGVAYIASAGNRANQSWDGTFTPGAGGLNDFGGGDTRQAVADVPNGGRIDFTLQWDEPWGARTDNFNIEFYENNVDIGHCAPNATAFPIQQCGLTNTTGSSKEFEIEITRVSGTGNPRMKYIARGNFGAFAVKEHATNQGAIDPDAASANGSLAAAAVCWSTVVGNCSGFAGLQTPENFSSRGPVVRTRDSSGNLLPAPETRQKPNVAGADGVSTDLAPASGLNPFFGTSAAAPSVAGVAALALSANPNMTVDQLYALLTNPVNSLDCTSAAGVPDVDCGAGFIQADSVVSQAKTPPAVSGSLSPAAPDGANGWYVSPVGVTWNVTDNNPSVVSKNGCDPTTVSTETGGTTLTCTATGAGGTNSGSVSFKLDSSPPTAPSITGISAKTYLAPLLPKPAAIACSATDSISGVDGCSVSGYSGKVGQHTLTATATNDAGLTSSSQLTYKVAQACVVPKLEGKSLGAATKSLKRAHCKVGKVKPKHPPKSFVVKSSSPRKGAVRRAGAKVKLKLEKKK